MIFAVVGGSALLTLMAHPAAAQRRCRCERPCPAWMTCGCGGERGGNLEIHWHCPSCGDYRCEYYQCTDRRCRWSPGGKRREPALGTHRGIGGCAGRLVAL